MGERIDDQRRVWIWWSGFVGVQVATWWWINGIEPDGFDRCTAAPTPEELRLQVWVAVGGTVLSAALAVVLWRGSRLVLALLAVAAAVLPYVVVLGGEQVC